MGSAEPLSPMSKLPFANIEHATVGRFKGLTWFHFKHHWISPLLWLANDVPGLFHNCPYTGVIAKGDVLIEGGK